MVVETGVADGPVATTATPWPTTTTVHASTTTAPPTTTLATVPTPTPPVQLSLRRDESGDRVTALQNRLTDLGYWLSPVDGTHGLLTEQAVTAFQKVDGFTLTGWPVPPPSGR